MILIIMIMMFHSNDDMITAEQHVMRSHRARRLDGLLKLGKKCRERVATVTGSAPPANWDCRLLVSKLMWLCDAYEAFLLGDSVMHEVAERSTTLTKHEKCSAPNGLQSNTQSICGTRNLSWGLAARQSLGQITGLHLVPEAMPRLEKLGRVQVGAMQWTEEGVEIC